MTILDLGDGLNAVKNGLRFAHFSWDPAPNADYGVYAEDDESLFRADNRHGEKTTIAYVNLFTRDQTGLTKFLVERYFNQLMDGPVTFGWYVNTMQYEEETRYIHIEWIVEFSNANEY